MLCSCSAHTLLCSCSTLLMLCSCSAHALLMLLCPCSYAHAPMLMLLCSCYSAHALLLSSYSCSSPQALLLLLYSCPCLCFVHANANAHALLAMWENGQMMRRVNGKNIWKRRELERRERREGSSNGANCVAGHAWGAQWGGWEDQRDEIFILTTHFPIFFWIL